MSIACLANNHIRDYGDAGVMETIMHCHAHGIETVGAGKNLHAAGKISFVSVKNTTLAFINYCEEEFSIAGKVHAGANPIDSIQAYYDIKEALQSLRLFLQLFMVVMNILICLLPS